MKYRAPSGQDLVSIGLMTDVPYELVVRCVINIVKGYGQFYDTEARAEMSSVYTHHIDDILT
jgi:hypothetical protein